MVILGSTGSIGLNALRVAKQFNIQIEALACGSNIELFNQQIKQFKPKFIAISNPNNLELLESNDSIVFVGDDGILSMLESCKTHNILNAVIGFAGLKFSLKILDLQKDLILANKESLVIAGSIIFNKIKQQNHKNNAKQTILDRIFPIDSEHFSLWSILYGHKNTNKNFVNLYITASGGALRDFAIKDLPNAKLCDVLSHPTWNMGKKITIDSATLVNKLYEILEACWLFDTKNIDALIERSSLIHAFVEFEDSSFQAHISHADMCLPIAYAIDPNKASNEFHIKKLSTKDFVRINFQEINQDRYPLWRYKNLLLNKPHLGIALNASNEMLQDMFLREEIPFCAFWKITSIVLERFEDIGSPQTLQDIMLFREEVIELSKFLIKKL